MHAFKIDFKRKEELLEILDKTTWIEPVKDREMRVFDGVYPQGGYNLQRREYPAAYPRNAYFSYRVKDKFIFTHRLEMKSLKESLTEMLPIEMFMTERWPHQVADIFHINEEQTLRLMVLGMCLGLWKVSRSSNDMDISFFTVPKIKLEDKNNINKSRRNGKPVLDMLRAALG